MKKSVIYVLIGAAFLAALFFSYRVGTKHPKEVITTMQYDTVITYKALRSTPSFTVEVPKFQIPILLHSTDTVHHYTDTSALYLEFVQRIQKDSAGLYTAYVSGPKYGSYGPSIDSLIFNISERTITETVREQVVKKVKPRYSISIQAGYGLPIVNQDVITPAPYVGVGLSYNLFSWGYKK